MRWSELAPVSSFHPQLSCSCGIHDDLELSVIDVWRLVDLVRIHSWCVAFVACVQAEQFVLAVVPARRLTATLGEFQDLETYVTRTKSSPLLASRGLQRNVRLPIGG